MRTGGPFKPSFGLSGVVPPAGRVSPRLVRAFLQSSRIQSLPVLPSPSRNGENYSTPNHQGAHTTHASLDCDESFQTPRHEVSLRPVTSPLKPKQGLSGPPRRTSSRHNRARKDIRQTTGSRQTKLRLPRKHSQT
jgi:hypothetical protein